eukprot:TRINITY_DN22678_c0_g1_i1.p1 TRINITY_DN22678_c0_g1~~TRINITY_DN22678_c0_g1_i1.p1  ORF type:complete len:425 (+),score=53.23 TRINITY_DN22678_c0_g1_i1:120-1394(+)
MWRRLITTPTRSVCSQFSRHHFGAACAVPQRRHSSTTAEPKIAGSTRGGMGRFSDPVESRNFTLDELYRLIRETFLSFGIPDADATTAAKVLIASDARGIESHGIARLVTYWELLKDGRINTNPDVRIVRETPSTATVDGDNGLGLVVAPKANEIAIEKAKTAGTGWVALRNSNHYGIAGWYSMQALQHDMIGWSFTNTTALVAPLWGYEKLLGTNPISIAIPAYNEPPVVVDFASSAVAYGKVEIASRENSFIPEGWALNKEGNPTKHPNEMKQGGALCPLGSTRDMGGHKGYCLSLAIDILCGNLGGANFGPWVPPFTLYGYLQQGADVERTGKGTGQFFGAMRVDAFRDADEFKKSVDQFCLRIRNTAPQPGTDGPLIPGDPEREAEALTKVDGVNLPLPVCKDLQRVAEYCKIDWWNSKL